MSDMSHLYRAYAAVHDTDVNQQLTESRDQISAMDLTQLTDRDLVLIAEEIVAALFLEGLGVSDSFELIASTLEESVDASSSPLRQTKVKRIAEAFDKTFDKVTSKASDEAIVEFFNYLDSKPLIEKWNGKVSHEHGNQRIHEAYIAKDKRVVLEGLISIISEKEQNAGKIGSGKLRDAVGNRAVGLGGAGFHGKTYGIGKDKRYKNDPKKDDARSATQKATAKSDRDDANTDKYGITPEQRRERARKNKADRLEREGTQKLKDLGWKGKNEEYIGVPSTIRQEWAEAYTSIYEKKLAAPAHDPVGQEDKDIDNDGDHDKTDKYLLNRRKVIGKAIAKKKGVKEGVTFSAEEQARIDAIVSSWDEGYQREPDQAGKKDRTHSKQPDPSKPGFTGTGNLSIAQIAKMSKEIEKKQK